MGKAEFLDKYEDVLHLGKTIEKTGDGTSMCLMLNTCSGDYVLVLTGWEEGIFTRSTLGGIYYLLIHLGYLRFWE